MGEDRAAGPELSTRRLLLRRWRASDRAPFAALNGDPVVMQHFPATATRRQSDELIAAIERGFDADGFGLWAVEVTARDEVVPAGTFVGFVGLCRVPFSAPFTPAVEVGWRLASAAWGRGFATEAAERSLAFGFEDVGLDEIVSFTAVPNTPSQAVMRRVGLRHAGTFEHPRLPEGHRLRTHVLYRLDRPSWSSRASTVTEGAGVQTGDVTSA